MVHEFEVPELGGFRVSTPVISDIHRPNREGQGVTPQILARRVFPQGSDLVCSFDVFGAAEDGTGMPQVVQGYTVERSDGVVAFRVPERHIRPTSLGALSRLVGFSLADVMPGDYEMQLTFRDELSGKTVELREPFSVVPAEETTEGASGPGASTS